MENDKVGYGKYKYKKFAWVASYDPIFFRQIPKLYFKNYSKFKKIHYSNALTLSGVISSDEAIDFKSEEVVGWIKGQVSLDEIKRNLSEEGFIDKKINESIKVAKNLIQKEYEEERDLLVDLHILRYEEMYYVNLEPNLNHIPPMYRKNTLAEHLVLAMETLSAKEKVLGMHSNEFRIKLNNFYVNNKIKSDPSYDLSKLNIDDLLTFLELINKTKYVEQLVIPIISKVSEVEEIETIVAEEIIDYPIQQSKQDDILQENAKKETINAGKTLDEVKNSINQTLEEKILAMYNKNKK